jgi:hypothetical protein
VLGVPTTFIREARRHVSRDEAAKPSQSFSKTRRHPFAKRTRLRLLSLNYGRENPKRTRSTQVFELLETVVLLTGFDNPAGESIEGLSAFASHVRAMPGWKVVV